MPDRPSTPLYSLTTLSLLSREMEEATLAGILHADIKLEAREYKTPTFSQTLLGVIRALRVPTWDLLAPELECIKISKVSGALTNAVFSISYADITPSRSPPPSMPCAGSPPTQTIAPCTVLLRIYGSSASKLIARSDELRILYTLSSIHRIGPRVFGTFRNGRIEEWFDSTPLTIKDIRDPAQSQWIGMRIRELHNIDVRSIVGSPWNGQESVLRDILFWKGGAQEVLDILKAKEDKGEIDPEHPWSGAREKLDLALFTSAWEAYWTWVRKQEGEYGRSEMVLAHNDLREGNLLRTYGLTPGILNHHQIIIIDFEYAAPNPAAFDIASHFNEWVTYYNRPDVSHLTTSYQYPTREERCNFYLGYLRPVPRAQPVVLPASQTSVDPLVHPSRGSPVSFVPNLDETEPFLDVIEQTSSTLDAQVLAWSPASHAYCTIWAIVQAHQDVMTGAIGEFDHLGYAMGRLEKFYEDLKERGIRW